MKITKKQLRNLVKELVRHTLQKGIGVESIRNDEDEEMPLFKEFLFERKLDELLDDFEEEPKVIRVTIDQILMDSPDQFNTDQLLLEFEQYVNIPKTTLMARLDKGNTNTMTQDHYHVYLKNNQLYAINKDGTPHDGSKACLGKKEIKFLKDKGFTIPKDGILEWIDLDYTKEYWVLNYQLLLS